MRSQSEGLTWSSGGLKVARDLAFRGYRTWALSAPDFSPPRVPFARGSSRAYAAATPRGNVVGLQQSWGNTRHRILPLSGLLEAPVSGAEVPQLPLQPLLPHSLALSLLPLSTPRHCLPRFPPSRPPNPQLLLLRPSLGTSRRPRTPRPSPESEKAARAGGLLTCSWQSSAQSASHAGSGRRPEARGTMARRGRPGAALCGL